MRVVPHNVMRSKIKSLDRGFDFMIFSADGEGSLPVVFLGSGKTEEVWEQQRLKPKTEKSS
jgi:hypothetical protein